MKHQNNNNEGFTRASIEDSFSLRAFAEENEKVQFSYFRFACVVVTGAVLGMGLSLAVNSVLFEVSVGPLFAFYFGLIFSLIGALIIMRAFAQPTVVKKLAVISLAGVIIGASVLCFLFRVEWLWWGSFKKVLIYSLLGIATSFTVTFSWVDIVTFVHDLAKRHQDGPSHKWGLVESPVQVWLISALSIVTGLTYGMIFGLVQLEELTDKHHSRQRLYYSLGRTQLFSLPFGAVLGALGAGLNEYLRYRNMVNAIRKDIEYKPLNMSDVDGV